MRKHTLEYVIKFFQEQNCELLETEYINSTTKMKYKCKCGDKSKTTFANFKNVLRCNKCAGLERCTYKYVETYFKEQNCKLLEMEYKNTKTKMKYICVCGNESNISFQDFKKGNRCRKCSGCEKLTFEYVKNYFQKQNCEVLETEYKNAKYKMKYKCKCGNESKITWNSFQQGTRCIKCSNRCVSEKLNIDFIRNRFLEKKCILLEEVYINSKTKMKCKCACNNEYYTTWDSFNSGHVRCKFCADENTAKKSFQFKDYIMPSKKKVRVQGYENIALDEILEYLDEKDIILSRRNMPNIEYIINNKKHRYYPDIYIQSQNKIIEIKSYYTYKSNLIKNIIKALSTRKLGYDFEFWIYDRYTFKKTII